MYCLNLKLSVKSPDGPPAIIYTFDTSGCEELELQDVSGFRIFFNDRESAEKAEAAVSRLETVTETGIEKVKDQDWNAEWRKKIEPVRVADDIIVSPPWLKPDCGLCRWVKIDSKQAFGSGHHETTRLIIRMLEKRKAGLKGASFLDVGTGSGILCITAGLYGAKPVFGVEIDSDCLENIAENRGLNNFNTAGGFVIGSAGETIRDGVCFDVEVMNMISTFSGPLLGFCRKHLEKDGFLVWSGLLVEERDEAVERAGLSSLSLSEEYSENEWWCGLFSPV